MITWAKYNHTMGQIWPACLSLSLSRETNLKDSSSTLILYIPWLKSYKQKKVQKQNQKTKKKKSFKLFDSVQSAGWSLGQRLLNRWPTEFS